MPGPTRNSRAMRQTTAATESDSTPVTARRMTCMCDMWWARGDVVAVGKEMDSADDDRLAEMREGTTGRKSRLMELVDRLNEFFQNLNRAGTHAAAVARNAKDRLNDGQSNCRSEDARKIFQAMPKWGMFTEPLGERGTRGLKHRGCATMLAPPTLNMSDDIIARTFMNDGIPIMTHEVFMSFMWAKGRFKPEQPSNGLFEGELMLLAAKAILYSPMASMPETIDAVGGAQGPTRRCGPIGIAKKYGLTHITPPFIAYAACVTRHALTGAKNFSKVCDGFSYTKFYYLIRKILESPKYEHWTKAVIQRWNNYLFAGYEFGLNNVEPIDASTTILGMLDAEIEGDQLTLGDLGLNLGAAGGDEGLGEGSD